MSSRKEVNTEAIKRIHASAKTYQHVFVDDSDGHKVLLDLMRKFHMINPLADKGDIDPNRLIFNEGARNVILYILTKCNINIQQLEDLIEGANNADL